MAKTPRHHTSSSCALGEPIIFYIAISLHGSQAAIHGQCMTATAYSVPSSIACACCCFDIMNSYLSTTEQSWRGYRFTCQAGLSESSSQQRYPRGALFTLIRLKQPTLPNIQDENWQNPHQIVAIARPLQHQNGRALHCLLQDCRTAEQEYEMRRGCFVIYPRRDDSAHSACLSGASSLCAITTPFLSRVYARMQSRIYRGYPLSPRALGWG
jgi:hypothetical protein